MAAPFRHFKNESEMISIALATYNGEKYLKEQLNSLLEQTMLPAELIVCDDMSTDGTIEIVSGFAKTAPFPVRLVVNQQRLGYRANFMKAATLCNSDFIAFCDQDDIWDREKIEVVFRHMIESNCMLLQHGIRLIDARGQIISEDIEYTRLGAGAPWPSSLGLTQVFRKSLLVYSHLWGLSIDHNFPDEKMGHDQWMHFLASILGEVITLKESLLSYRQHNSNTFGFSQPYQHDPAILKSNLRVLLSRFSYKDASFFAKRSFLEGHARKLASCAYARMRILEGLMSSTQKSNHSKIEISLLYYRTFYRYYDSRVRIYSAPSIVSRLHNLIALYTDRSYQERGLRGIKDSVLDLFYGAMG
jgi:glycosyltransferase involved in cell wall biosynthesis